MRRAFLTTLTLAAALTIGACTPMTGNPATTSPTAGAPASVGTATSAPGTGLPVASADAVTTIVVRDFELGPTSVAVTGTTLSMAVTNDGPTVHNVKVRNGAGAVLFGTRDLREDESETVIQAIAPGEYVLFCSLPGHESLGIKGTLTVTAP